MPTNKIVADKSAQIKNSNFDMTHNYDATVGFGEVIPTFFQFLHQPSKNNLRQFSSVRMFPLSAPTLGTISVKNTANFIGISEVFPKWKNVLSNKTGLSVFTDANPPAEAVGDWAQTATKYMPCLDANLLHFIIFQCCKGFCERYPMAYANVPSPVPDHLQFTLNTSQESTRKNQWLALSGLNRSSVNRTFFESLEVNDRRISPTVNDFDERVLIGETTSSGSTNYFYGLYRLTRTGKRVKKILDSLGYVASAQNGGSNIVQSLLPLFAFYRAYFINYLLPLQNYFDWENTYCYKLIESFSHEAEDCYINSRSTFAYKDVTKKRIKYLIKFFEEELSVCCYTDNTLESACLNDTMLNKNMGVNPFANLRTYDSFSFMSQPLINNVGGGQNSINPKIDGSTLSAFGLSQLDLEALKRMFIYVSRNSIEGAEIEKELIARGYVDFVSQCNCRYLGSYDYDLDISEIDSVTDSAQTIDGKQVGEIVGEPNGKGFGSSNGKSINFANSEPGFFFIMSSIVPVVRGKQNLNPSLLQTSIESWYNQMFDGLGYEALPQCYLSYMNDITDVGDTEVLDSSFGIVPRYSSLKTRKDILVGQLNDSRSFDTIGAYVLTGTIQRNPDLGEISSDGKYILPYKKSVGPVENSVALEYRLPTSSILWCRTLLSSYFGNFDRLFNERSRLHNLVVPNNRRRSPWDAEEMDAYGNDSYIDSFILHCTNVYDLTTQMLPIALSYSCSSDETSTKVEI